MMNRDPMQEFFALVSYSQKLCFIDMQSCEIELTAYRFGNWGKGRLALRKSIERKCSLLQVARVDRENAALASSCKFFPKEDQQKIRSIIVLQEARPPQKHSEIIGSANQVKGRDSG